MYIYHHINHIAVTLLSISTLFTINPVEYKSDLSIGITVNGCPIQFFLVVACFFPVINDFFFLFYVTMWCIYTENNSVHCSPAANEIGC